MSILDLFINSFIFLLFNYYFIPLQGFIPVFIN